MRRQVPETETHSSGVYQKSLQAYSWQVFCQNGGTGDKRNFTITAESSAPITEMKAHECAYMHNANSTIILMLDINSFLLIP